MSEKPVDAANKTKHWNSLEIAKLAVGVLTPVSLLFISSQISRSEKIQAEEAARFQRVAEQRSLIWKDLSPKLNDIYEYLMYVGSWRTISAADVVRNKREADRIFFENRPFFSDKFSKGYDEFMAASFQTTNGMGEDPIPRTTANFRAKTDEGAVSGRENWDAIHTSYYHLLDAVADDFGLDITTPKRQPTPLERAGTNGNAPLHSRPTAPR
jgi:hypothetical protein